MKQIYFILPATFFFFLIHANAQSLRIDSNPQGARVTCDGKTIGITPFMYVITPENHILEFTHPDSIHTKTVNLKNVTEEVYSFNSKTIFADFKINMAKSILKDSGSAVVAPPDMATPTATKQRMTDKKFHRTHSNVFSWQLPAMLIHELQFSYERRITNRVWLGISGGLKQAQDGNSRTYANHDDFDSDGPINEIALMPFSESRYGSFNIKYYVFHFFYVNAEFFNRTMKYDNATISWYESYGRNGVKAYSDRLDANITSRGIKIEAGARKVFPINEHIGFTVEGYYGLGLRIKNVDLYHYNLTTTYGKEYKTYNTPPSPEVITNKAERTQSILPSVQVGIKIGLQF